MKVRLKILAVLCLLALAAAWYLWPHTDHPVAGQTPVAPLATVGHSAPVINATNEPVVKDSNARSAASTNRVAFRVANTPKSITQLAGDRHAILLENAFIDTTAAMDLKIPKHLQAGKEPGAYIVQSRGVIDSGFRNAIAGAGGTVVSYIPNNAFLVQVSSAGAAVLADNTSVQAVLPYEPYYKVQASLLDLAINQKPLPAGTYLTLGLYSAGADATVTELEKMGAEIMGRDRSPFGPIVRVRAPADWIALAQLPGVGNVEPVYRRKLANDLTRVALGVSTNTTDGATNNYLGLTGKNIIVEVNDTGVDAKHPDFSLTGTAGNIVGVPPSRVFGDFTNSLYDTDGHGTHVAGIIAGNGSESYTITNVSGSVTNADFRGKAPLASIFSIGAIEGGHDFFSSDSYLQEMPALTNALISNNSWTYGDDGYDLAAASYDAAVRDAIPEATGPQPVLFVFAAGNDGNGADNGTGGFEDSIGSPGTAKDVITVGALEELRNITNIVTALDGSSNAIWSAMTDSGFQVAGYSSRGNVGVQTEGAFGRFKPDVVAPGTFAVSLRSQNWDEEAYYNPTNFHVNEVSYFVTTNTLAYGFVTVPENAVGVSIQVVPNILSPTPFPTNFPIYISRDNVPDPTDNTTYDIYNGDNSTSVSIPPAANGVINSIDDLRNSGFIYAVGDATNLTIPINFDVIETIITTNDLGNQLLVLSNLNNSLGGSPDSKVPPHYYRYESGTSMATPAVSGVLALMQDFFVNQKNPNFATNPSPALLKAMVINGARLTGNYQFAVTNTLNYEGWGQVNLPNSVPAALTNTVLSVSNGVPMFFVDQSPTNALATGDRRTYNITFPNAAARQQPLRITLAWTDPPGNPVAAYKLVNDLDLVVTNNDNPTNPVIYFGNSFNSSGAVPYSAAGNSNSVADNINNVENVFLPPTLGTNYSVTVIAHAVNVNAVTLEQTNIVQDFALVISSGDGSNTNGITVTPVPPTPGSTADVPRVDYLASTNGLYFNQYAGAYSPWLSTNGVTFGSGSTFATNAIFHIGQTNQWHFYVVTNTTGFTNAAFIIFLPETAAIPREGVFANTDANSTRPEADLELFVASPLSDPLAPQLTNLNFTVISNCIYNLNGDSASIGRGGSEFVAYSNSQPNQVYYIGVQCEDQMAGQYAFVPIFSQEPFSTTDQNGNTYVHGVNMPVNIPDGNNAHPGVGYVIGLSLQAQTVSEVIVTNTFTHQNFGDLIGSLSHSGNFTTLNNHDGFGAVTPAQQFIYDDTGAGDVPGARHSDGPGNLQNFRGQPGVGLWLLTEVDDSFSQTGAVTSFQMKIKPHKDLKGFPFIVVSVPAGGWFYDYVDVPVGYTNLLVVATNLPPTAVPPIQLFVKEGGLPTLADTNDEVTLTNCLVGTYPTGLDPGNSLSLGPPLVPDRYFVGLYNPDGVAHDVLIGAILSFNSSAINNLNFRSTDTPLPLLDDALTLDPLTGQNSTIFVPNTDIIQSFSVGLRVDHPRISDMVFTLISPDGSRYLLMENRGGQSTNGCGTTFVTTNNFTGTANGNGLPNTNFYNLGSVSGTVPITYNFFTAPDEMTIYYGTNISTSSLIYDTGLTNGQLNFTLNYGPTNGIVSTYLTVIMNQFATTTNGADAWNYTVGGVQTNYAYLSFTEDTNLTTTPIKFAQPPFTPVTVTNVVIVTNITLVPNTTNISSFDFEGVAAGDYAAGSGVDGWNIISNQTSVVSDPPNAQAGSQFLALANSSISRVLTTVVGSTNTLTFAYRGPGVVSWWRYESSPLVDNVGGYKAQFVNGGGFTIGEVGNGISLDGIVDYLLVQPPVSSKLDVGLGSGVTMELWIKPTRVDLQSLMFRYEKTLGSGNGSDEGMEFNIHPGGFLRANIVDSTANGHVIISAANTVLAGIWQHAALTYNRSSGNAALYLNGAPVAQANLGIFTPQTSFTNLLMGTGTYLASSNRPAPINMFAGDMDETSIYKRALSASEIKAIWQAGSVGKVDRGYPIPSDFSEARLTLDNIRTIAGIGTNTLLGNNTTWQTNTITFVATTNSTILQLDGVEPGMLLDSFTLTSSQYQTNYVTNIVVTTSNLYYQAEQSLLPLIGTGARGNWQLEALDNRAGATNPQPELVSWQLSFTFANTNFTIPIGNLNNGINQTNFAPAGSLTWFAISVPTNAIAQTNTLIFASLPLNIWFSTNTPPTTNSPFGTEEQTNSLGGIVVVYPNSTPLPMIPGTTNYLGVQNPNQFGATYAISVNFELTNLPVLPYGSNNVLPFANSLPATSVTGTNAQLNGFATPNLTNGSTATAWFQWGPTIAYGNVTPPNNVGFGFSVIYQDAFISGLIFGQVYHYRLVVSNSVGVVYGADEQFAPGYPVSWGDNTFGQTNVPVGLANVVALAGGLGHSLALLDDGTMTGWGDNTFGQIVSPLNLGPVAAIAAGDHHNLALLANGTVTAWGDNRSGQTNIPAGLGLTSAVAVAAGASNSVALLFDGTVVAWGDNTFGQTNVPPGLSNVVAIASGGNDVVALLNNGTVVGWGDNRFGQTNVPAGVSNLVAVAAGTYHNLGLYTNGLVVGWGDNTVGETTIAPSVTNVVAIAAGFVDNLILQGTGTVIAWGINNFGQTNVPPGLSQVYAVACGVRHDLVLTAEPPLLPPYAHTLPATSVTGTNAQINGFATPNATNGSVVAAWFRWGASTNYANQTPAVSVGNGLNVVYVTNQIAGLMYGQTYHFQLVVSNYIGVTYGFDQLLVAGSSIAWGDNTYGQSTVPTGLSKEALTNVVMVAAGGLHSLEILTNGAVLAWGNNANGQATVPAGLSNTVSVAGGFFHSLALQSNGVVMAWGDNTFGQSTVPAGASNMVAVAGGGFASLALRNNGLITAWGDNTFGQTNVPALSNVVEVAEGTEHSLALLNNGTVAGWGTNQYGQISVPALNNVVAVAAGNYHSLALLGSGAVVAWGLNNLGQATVPAICSSNVVAIAAGGYHSVALLNNGNVVVWGDNTLGQANVPSSVTNVAGVAAGTYHSVVLTSPFPISLNLFPYPTNNLPVTNIVGPGQINWFQINVPTNAIAATNTLLFATQPVNMWWSTNFPPSITTINDAELLTGQTSGSVVLYHNTPRPTIVAGGAYYLGIQNPNSLPVTNAVQVTFEYAVPPVLPPVQFEFVQGGDTLVVTNTAFDIYPLDVLNYTLSTNVLFTFPIPPNNTNTAVTPVISPNGIITWAVPTNTAVTFSLFNTTVTDTNTGLGDANSFFVIAFPRFGIGVPVTNGAPSNSITWTLIHVPTNAIAATNTLVTSSAPVNLWYSTNLPPTITNSSDIELLTNSVNGTNVISITNTVPLLLPGGFYFLGVENKNSFAITNV
ncbi:MAG TPA: S8 family serine peptidase, partial [Verrucomicrobiae bacterium]|nr:S8 family serine peptidase [Verrucomicrobiae bacterium]